MGTVISWLGENWGTLLVVVSGVISGASVIVAALAPVLKKTEKDEKALVWLRKVSDFLSKLALNPKK